MNPIAIGEWANFFVAQVSASSALAGLVVVAISFNLSKIMANPHLPGRAAEPLIVLIGALIVTSIGLVPGLRSGALGAAVVIVGALMFVLPLALQIRAGRDAPRWIVRAVATAMCSLSVAFGGILVLVGSGAGLYWIAAGVIISLIVGVFSAWVLLIEILR
jgi:hypothetical protein